MRPQPTPSYLDTQKHGLCYSMIRRLSFPVSILLLSSSVITATVFGQTPKSHQAGWRGTVACESLAVYSQMSTQSRVVSQLKKEDVVTIDLEFITSGGVWSSVREIGKRMRLGYVRSDCLERDQTDQVTKWETQSLPPETTPHPQPAQHIDIAVERRPTREEIEREVDRALGAKLDALLPPNDSGQTELREPLWLDDRTSFPFLPGFGVPFDFTHRNIAHRNIGPRSIPPHIPSAVQIRPSHIFRRR